MYTTIHAAPDAKNVRAWMFDGSRERIRVLLLTDADERTHVEIPMDRAVLDALQAALDEIRADMDAAAQTADADADARDENAKTAARDWPSVLSDMAPEPVAS